MIYFYNNFTPSGFSVLHAEYVQICRIERVVIIFSYFIQLWRSGRAELTHAGYLQRKQTRRVGVIISKDIQLNCTARARFLRALLHARYVAWYKKPGFLTPKG